MTDEDWVFKTLVCSLYDLDEGLKAHRIPGASVREWLALGVRGYDDIDREFYLEGAGDG